MGADAGVLRIARGEPEGGEGEWHIVFAKGSWNGDAAQIEKIDKIGVSAELRIQSDRVSFDLREGDWGRHGRHHQRIDMGEGRESVIFEGSQAVKTAERID